MLNWFSYCARPVLLIPFFSCFTATWCPLLAKAPKTFWLVCFLPFPVSMLQHLACVIVLCSLINSCNFTCRRSLFQFLDPQQRWERSLLASHYQSVCRYRASWSNGLIFYKTISCFLDSWLLSRRHTCIQTLKLYTYMLFVAMSLTTTIIHPQEPQDLLLWVPSFHMETFRIIYVKGKKYQLILGNNTIGHFLIL